MPDENPIHGFALAGVAGHNVAVIKMPEVFADGPAVVEDDIALPGEPIHDILRTVIEPMLAIGGFAVLGKPEARVWWRRDCFPPAKPVRFWPIFPP